MQQQKADEQFGPVRDIKMRCNDSKHNIHQASNGVSQGTLNGNSGKNSPEYWVEAPLIYS
jgi:hypothetical protein